MIRRRGGLRGDIWGAEDEVEHDGYFMGICMESLHELVARRRFGYMYMSYGAYTSALAIKPLSQRL